jgi:hypothetical protein
MLRYFSQALNKFSVCFVVSEPFRKMNRNKKSAFQNKPKLEINTLLYNGHGRGHGHGHGLFYFVSFFRMVFECFAYIETPKQDVSVFKRNNLNKRLVSDSAETSFGSSFDYIETKLVS